MVRVCFTPNIQRHVECPPEQVAGATVREALDRVFEQNPRARGYVLDEQGAVRRHIVIFVNNQPIRDRERLTDPLTDGAEVFVMQALSGG